MKFRPRVFRWTWAWRTACISLDACLSAVLWQMFDWQLSWSTRGPLMPFTLRYIPPILLAARHEGVQLPAWGTWRMLATWSIRTCDVDSSAKQLDVETNADWANLSDLICRGCRSWLQQTPIHLNKSQRWTIYWFKSIYKWRVSIHTVSLFMVHFLPSFIMKMLFLNLFALWNLISELICLQAQCVGNIFRMKDFNCRSTSKLAEHAASGFSVPVGDALISLRHPVDTWASGLGGVQAWRTGAGTHLLLSRALPFMVIFLYVEILSLCCI